VVKEGLTNMSEEESTRFEPVFKFGDEEAKNRFEDRAGVTDSG